MLPILVITYASTPVSDWLHARELCGPAGQAWALSLCEHAEHLDQYGFNPDTFMPYICLPWDGKYLPICTDDDKKKAITGATDAAMRFACGASMSSNECYAKYSAPRMAQAWANCNILDICNRGMADAVTQATSSGAAGSTSAAVSLVEGVNAAAQSAREAAKEAALAAGKSAAAAGQAGRRAAEHAAKETAQKLGAEVTKVTANGVEVVAEGASSWLPSLQSSVSFVGPAVGGIFNAGFEAYKGGLTTKVGSKFASGAAGNAAGVAVSVACGPAAWICAPFASVLATNAIDYFVVDSIHDEVALTKEEEQLLEHALKDAVNQQKKEASKPALIFALAAQNALPTSNDLANADSQSAGALIDQLEGKQKAASSWWW